MTLFSFRELDLTAGNHRNMTNKRLAYLIALLAIGVYILALMYMGIDSSKAKFHKNEAARLGRPLPEELR